MRTDGDILAGLTAPQAQAVQHTEGPLLVLAGPGSGKTRVITRRIAYLVQCGIPPWQILALTFTNKAAAEMRERVHALLGEGAATRGLVVTTFHALCARLLRKYAPIAAIPGIDGNFVIYDTDDQTRLVKRAIETLDLSTSNWPARSVLGRISDAKNKLQDAAAFAAIQGDFYGRTLARIYAEYQKGLRAADAVDFDDLLLLVARMLRDNTEVHESCRARWQYLLVDEYQDTNKAQFEIAALLAAGTGAQSHSAAPPRPANICVVGDPDQSIYGWRGADIGNILDFETQFPGASVIALGENFRSTKHIIGAADILIRRNTRRKHKDLYTANPQGDKIEIVMCRDEHHEADLVVDWLKARSTGPATTGPGTAPRTGNGSSSPRVAWKDMAVFYRTNALSRVIEDRLRAEAIPYIIARGTAFYQREEVKHTLAYLRVVANPLDDVSVERILNVPARGIGDTTLAKVQSWAAQHGLGLFDALSAVSDPAGPAASSGAGAGVIGPKAAASIAKFVAMVNEWRGLAPEGTLAAANNDRTEHGRVRGLLADLVERVVRGSGLEAMYRAGRTDTDEERLENLAELVSSAAEFEETYEPGSDPVLAREDGVDAPREQGIEAVGTLGLLRAYLERVTLVSDADAIDPDQGAVTLMTLHAAKGLEFPAVAMIGLEEGVLPHSRVAENPSELEEERRLCFVGITRAMRRLLITSSRYRSVRGISERTIESRFIAELPREHVTMSDQSAWQEAGWDVPGAASRGSAGSPRASEGGTRTSASRSVGGLNIGARVRHPQFGIGEVVGMTAGGDARAQVRFRDVGVKTLVLAYARLERLD